MIPLELDQVTKTYRSGWRRTPATVLHGITLQLREGECFGYLGANGAGKTTTMKILLSLIGPSSGTARLWGLPVERPESRRRIGFVPEEPSLPHRITPREFLDFGGRLCGMHPILRRERCRLLIERLGLGGVADAPLRRLSKGQRQRAALAQALVNDPDLLLLDEPLSGLDVLGRHDVIDLLSELRREGKTIFLCSHLLPDVERLCDRVGVLKSGRLAAVGTRAELALALGRDAERSGLEEIFLAIVGAAGAAPVRARPATAGRGEPGATPPPSPRPRPLVGIES